MQNSDQLSIVRTRRILFYDVRHANGNLISKTFDRAAAESRVAEYNAEHPDSPCFIQEQTAIVVPEPLYVSKRGKVCVKVPAGDALSAAE